jgi:hypothetical protein
MLGIADALSVGNFKKMTRIFELIHTYEFEISDESCPINGKFELLQDIRDKSRFSLRIFILEMFQLTTAFSDEPGKDLNVSHETFWVESVFPGKDCLEKEFNAKDVEEAKKFVISRINGFFKHLGLD